MRRHAVLSVTLGVLLLTSASLQLACRNEGLKVAHEGWVTALAFSPDGRLLASGSRDKTVILWDVETRKPSRTLEHQEAITSVSFTAEETSIVAVGVDEVRVWNSETGELRQAVAMHSYSLTASLQQSRDHEWFELWQRTPEELKRIFRFAFRGTPDPTAFSPDGRTLARPSSSARFPGAPMPPPPPPPPAGGYATLPLGVYRPPPAYGVDLWDTETGTVKSTLEGHSALLLSLFFSSDGKTLVTLAGEDRRVDEVFLWDVEKGSLRHSLRLRQTGEEALPQGEYIQLFQKNVALSADSMTLAAVITRSYQTGGWLPWRRRRFIHVYEVVLYELKSGQKKRILATYSTAVAALAFSPDRRVVAVGTDDGRVGFLEVE